MPNRANAKKETAQDIHLNYHFMLAVLPLLLAPALQQDILVQPAGPSPKPGRVTQVTQYGDRFATGWELDPQGRKQAVRYSDGMTLNLGAFMPGGESAGMGINVGGQVVGWAEDLIQGAPVRRPFVFDDANGLRAIPLPQATEGWAVGADTFGFGAAGTMRRADGLLQAWMVDFSPSLATAVPLDTPADWESEALVMIQENGLSGRRVGGFVRDPSGREFAAIWDDVFLSILPTPGTGNARVTGLESSSWGMVCGTFLDAAGAEQGFILDPSDPANSLFVLPSLGGTWTSPAGISFGVVYGASENSQGQSRAFQYTIDRGLMENLNDRAPMSTGVALTGVTSLPFASTGELYSFDLDVNGTAYGAVASTTVMTIWPRTAGASSTLSLFEGPANRPVAFAYGFAAGQTAVPGFPGLVLNLQQAAVVATGQTDSLGQLMQTIQVPLQAAGSTILFQAVVPDSSITTSVVTVTFD